MKPFIIFLACFYIHATEPSLEQPDATVSLASANVFKNLPDPNSMQHAGAMCRSIREHIDTLKTTPTDLALKNTNSLIKNYPQELVNLKQLLIPLLSPDLTYLDAIKAITEHTSGDSDYFQNLARKINPLLYTDENIDKFFNATARLELSIEKNSASQSKELTKTICNQKNCADLMSFMIFMLKQNQQLEHPLHRGSRDLKTFVKLLMENKTDSMTLPIQQIYFLYYIIDILLSFHDALNKTQTEETEIKLFSEYFEVGMICGDDVHHLFKHAIYMIGATYKAELDD